MMKRLLLIPALFLLGLFLFTTKVSAQECSYSRNSTGVLIVSSACPDGYSETAANVTDMYHVPDCKCIAENPGTNCITSGVPIIGQSCCTGYRPESRSGACIPNEANPYVIPTSDSNTLNDVHGDCGETKIDTAIGCIPVLNSDGGKSFMTFILRWATGIGGGIAFLLILYGGFIVMTSTGNPERLKAGQELLTSAISGLVLLIFSIFVLNFIGINILGIFK